MGWGTTYKHEGYLNRIYKSQIPHRKEECIQNIEDLWALILSYMASTPPAYAKGDGDYEYPYSEFLVSRLKEIREELEENIGLLHRITDCEETMRDDPENVKDDMDAPEVDL